jgi:hypothetical protein
VGPESPNPLDLSNLPTPGPASTPASDLLPRRPPPAPSHCPRRLLGLPGLGLPPLPRFRRSGPHLLARAIALLGGIGSVSAGRGRVGVEDPGGHCGWQDEDVGPAEADEGAGGGRCAATGLPLRR